MRELKTDVERGGITVESGQPEIDVPELKSITLFVLGLLLYRRVRGERTCGLSLLA